MGMNYPSASPDLIKATQAAEEYCVNRLHDINPGKITFHDEDINQAPHSIKKLILIASMVGGILGGYIFSGKNENTSGRVTLAPYYPHMNLATRYGKGDPHILRHWEYMLGEDIRHTVSNLDYLVKEDSKTKKN